MKNSDRMELAHWAMDLALKSGADQAAVTISNSRDIDINYREKKIEKLQESTQNSLYVQIYANKKYSGHSTNDLKKDSLKKFIEEGVAGTKYLSADEFRLLPEPRYYEGRSNLDLKIIDSDYEKTDSDSRVNIAAEIEKAAMEQSDLIISTTSSYSDSSYDVIQINSNGFSGEYIGTVFSTGASVTVKDKDGGRPEDWFYASTRFKGDLPDPQQIGRYAADRALKKIGQKKIESGQYDLIIENRAASRLVGVLIGAMSARSVQQKNSFLEGMIGKKIASERLTLIDDPLLEKGLSSRLFDGEGITAKRRVMIEKGILKNFYVDNYYGRKLGMELTSGGTSNLLLEYGGKPLDEIIKNIKKGILVNGFIGGNSNGTTGDFSFGIVGLLVEGGEIVKPVNEMNISGNALEVWSQLVEVGNDPYPYSSWKIPALHFEKINFSGI